MASHQHANGEPLFDLGISPDQWAPADAGARDRRGAGVTEPRIETPPPDDEGAADRATINAVLADLGWQRHAPSGFDVLAVGDHVGRAIAYRQSQFVYESTVAPDYRNTQCTFSTSAAARRWLITELSGNLRLRTGMPRIQPNRLAPQCTLERAPTGWDLAWSDGRASFRLGTGHVHAMTFSWVVTAELDEIAASFRHRKGEPLLDLGQESQLPG